MSIQRTTKIYINDQDTVIGASTKHAGTLSGYVHVTTVFDPELPESKMTAQYRITTTTPSVSVLSDWDAMYKGAVISYKKHYKNNYENVSVKCGDIIQERNLQMGVMRDTVVACWVAAYDKNVIAFQIHYPSGAIFQSHDIAMGINARQQRETDNVVAVKTTCDPSIKMSTPKVKESRRKGSKLSFEDEQGIIAKVLARTADGKKQFKQKDIAHSYNVTPMAISKLIKTLKAEGKL